jgi:hypothetical protein
MNPTNLAIIDLSAKITTLSLMRKKTSRGNSIQAPQARMSNPKSEVGSECEERPMIRKMRYSRKTTI